MNTFDWENAFGQPPAEFTQGMTKALERMKEEKPVKKFTIRTLSLAAALVLLLCGIALAVSNPQGVEWFLTQRYADPPTLPEDFSKQVQSDLPQENTGDFLDVVVQDAAWLDDQKYNPNSFQVTLQAKVKDAANYEMHEEFSLNTDGDTSERNGADWLWTTKGFGPIPDMMTDPKKTLVFFDSGEFTMGTPDGAVMPVYSEDTLLNEDGAVLCYLIIPMNELDSDWVQKQYAGRDYLPDFLKRAQAFQEAKPKYTDADGLTTLVFNYSCWEYPYSPWQYPGSDKSHTGHVTFQVKLP